MLTSEQSFQFYIVYFCLDLMLRRSHSFTVRWFLFQVLFTNQIQQGLPDRLQRLMIRIRKNVINPHVGNCFVKLLEIIEVVKFYNEAEKER